MNSSTKNKKETLFVICENDCCPMNPRKEFDPMGAMWLKTPKRYDYVGSRNGGEGGDDEIEEFTPETLIDAAEYLTGKTFEFTNFNDWMEDWEVEEAWNEESEAAKAFRTEQAEYRIFQIEIPDEAFDVYYIGDPEEYFNTGATLADFKEAYSQYAQIALDEIKKHVVWIQIYADSNLFSPDLPFGEDFGNAIGFNMTTRDEHSLTEDQIVKWLKQEVKLHAAYLSGDIYEFW